MEAKGQEIEAVKRAEQQRLERLDKAQQELDAVEKELEELPPYQPKTEEIVRTRPSFCICCFVTNNWPAARSCRTSINWFCTGS